jgi:hypothetical protein
MKNCDPHPGGEVGEMAIDTVPFTVCFSLFDNSGGKYRGGLTEELDEERRYEASDSPPVPVAVGSPV